MLDIIQYIILIDWILTLVRLLFKVARGPGWQYLLTSPNDILIYQIDRFWIKLREKGTYTNTAKQKIWKVTCIYGWYSLKIIVVSNSTNTTWHEHSLKDLNKKMYVMYFLDITKEFDSYSLYQNFGRLHIENKKVCRTWQQENLIDVCPSSSSYIQHKYKQKIHTHESYKN